MSESSSNKQYLMDQLVYSGCIKFGEFTLKSGNKSPYYIDLREATMHPLLFQAIVQSVKTIIPENKRSNDWSETSKKSKTAIIGIPYGVVPLAAAVAYESKIVYYPVRKEVKEYGHKPDTSLYDNYEFILIEDVMSTGSSIIETIQKLDSNRVTDVVVVINRESGGEENIKAKYPNIRLHSILRATELLKYRND